MELLNIFMVTAAALGFINLSKSLLNFSRWIWAMFFRPEKNLREYGSWALVTGATDGIGKAIAFDLASRGLNLVLVARSPSRLRATSEQIEHKYPLVAVKTVVIDFAKCRREEIARIIGEETEGLDLGILINNVGTTYPFARFLHEVDLELMESVMRVNVEGTTWVTRSVVRGMLEKKKRGLVVNIGSGSAASIASFPLYTIYAATKAFVRMLSKSISLEYEQHGIDVQCQIPLLVATKMTAVKRPSFLVPSAETYSKASMRWIGHSDRTCVPYWPHSLQIAVFNLFPDTLFDWCLFNFLLGMRARGDWPQSLQAGVLSVFVARDHIA